MTYEDEIQETFLRAHSYLHTLQEPGCFASWITRIAVNRAYTRVRKISRRHEAPFGTREMVDDAQTDHPTAWEYSFPWLLGCEALRSAMDALPAEWRVPVLLWAVDGCSLVEVGQRLGVSEKVEARRIRHGCQQVRANASVAA